MHRRTRQHEEESMGLHQRPKVLDRSLQILPFFLAYCYASYNSFSIDSIDAARARIDVKFWFCVRNISNSNTSNFEVLDYARFQPASSESRYVSPGIHTALTPLTQQRGKGGVTPYGVTRGFLDGSHAPR